MLYTGYGKRSEKTPQTEPIPGKEMVKNNAGGFSFAIDDHGRLLRFLILGSASSTYYASQRTLTKDNLGIIEKMLAAGQGRDVVSTIVEVSQAGRASSNDPALFALARCAAADDIEVRRAAYAALPQVARIGTHLLHFVMYVKQFRGWSRGLRKAVSRWFTNMPERKLSYQLVKYQSRDGYSKRDVLRLAHPKAPNNIYNDIFHWVTQGCDEPGAALQIIRAFEKAKHITSDTEMASLIRKYELPREAIPTHFLNSVTVWQALLETMPMEAMLRNLATMTRVGLIKALGRETKEIAERLRDGEVIRKARLHPIKVLTALITYESGSGVRGQNTWTPVQQIVDALNDAFYLSFGNVTPTGKNILIALDVSGSMGCGSVGNIPGLTPRVASAAMALVTASVESSHIMGFSHELVEIPISPKQRLDTVVKIIDGVQMGYTDCALPMIYAMKHNLEVDAFVVYTDSETYFGSIHPTQALQLYRRKTGIPAKLIVVGMVSNGFSIADSNDAGMLDIVGFDSSAPEIMSHFIAGEI